MINRILVLIVMTLSQIAVATDFTAIFACGKENAEICLHGSFHQDDNVWLLPKEGTQICQAKVGFQYLHTDDHLIFGATQLQAGNECGRANDYFLAAMTSLSKSFSNIELKPLESDERADGVLQAIAKAKLLDRQFKASGQKVTYTSHDLTDRTDVFMIADGLVKIFIAGYQLKQNGRGPVVTSIHGRLQSLGDVCSHLQKAFRFDNESYLITNSYCCDCGWTEQTIYKYNDNDFEKVYANRDWPNR